MTTPARKRVLVVDDDPAIRALLARVLHGTYDVMIAEDGPSALAILSGPAPPHVALLDVMMPGLDGFDLAHRMKLIPEAKRIPIIFLTARDTPKDMIRGIQVGARHYITKPFALKDVLEKIAHLLGS